jgi:hypothetical protein
MRARRPDEWVCVVEIDRARSLTNSRLVRHDLYQRRHVPLVAKQTREARRILPIRPEQVVWSQPVDADRAQIQILVKQPKQRSISDQLAKSKRSAS